MARKAGVQAHSHRGAIRDIYMERKLGELVRCRGAVTTALSVMAWGSSLWA
jgi:hypothetical protein